MPDYTPLSFVGNDTDPKSRIAMAMIQQGMDASPIKSWTQGANRVLQSLFGNMMLKDQQSSQKDAMSGVVDALLSKDGAASDAPAQPSTPTIPSQAMSGSPVADTAAPLSGGTLPSSTADSSLPRGLRNNNPLNIESGDFTQGQPGYSGTDGRFAKFASQDQGMSAADNLIQSYAGKGINTISGIVGRWAPPTDNNPTGAYAATVAKAVGVDPNTPLDMSNPAIRQKIAGAMAQFENGRPLPASISSGPQNPSVMQPSPMSPPMAFNGQPQPDNPLANGPGAILQPPGSPMSPMPASSPFPMQPNGANPTGNPPPPTSPPVPMPQPNPLAAQAQSSMQPPPAGPAPNITNVPTAPAQLPIGNGAQQPGKPILAPPQRANPQVPDNVRQAIQTAMSSNDPNTSAMGLAMLQKFATPQSYGFQTAGDGTILRTNPQTGSVEPVYQGNKPSFVPNASHDQYGNAVGGFVDPTNQSVKLIGPNGQPIAPNAAGGSPSDAAALTGDAFLKTLDPGKAETVKGIAEGRIPYPSGFIMKTPYGQWLTQAVGQYEPGVDATKIGERATFNKQMGSATPTSVGGQRTLMGTSLGHLADVAETATKLPNTTGILPDWMPGSSNVAQGINSVRNTENTNQPTANAFNDAVAKFSGEIGKLYSGSSGGGIHEREQTRERLGANLTPPAMASTLEMSKALITSKLQALESQQDQIFGPNSKGRVDFLGENGRAAVAKIDAAIEKLRGGQGSQPQAAPQGGQPVTKTIGGKTYVNQGGQWFQQ